MDLSHSTLRWQRAVVLAMVVLTAVVVWRPLPDPFGVTKATALWTGAVVLLGLTLVRAAWTRVALVPRSPLLWALVGFFAAVTVATLASPTVALSIVGEYSRNTGLATYASYVVVGFVVLRTFDVDDVARFLQVLTGTAGVLILYGLLQLADADPYDWGTLGFGPAFATLGNANLFAGFLAISLPAAAWLALTHTVDRWWRFVGVAVTVVGFAVAVSTQSFMGPAAALPALALLLAVWSTTEDGRAARREVIARLGRWRRPVLGAVAVAVLGAGVVGAGILSRGLKSGFIERGSFWRAALEMAKDKPLLGEGFDTYGQHFFAVRPAEHARQFFFTEAQSAHNVPLNLLAGGGLVVLVAWLAVVGVTGWALVRGLRRLDGEERLLLGALGASWVGYLVQALVSFDQPPLGLLHFILAGAIVAIGVPPAWRELRLPGTAARTQGRARGKVVVVPTSTWVAVGVVTVACVAGAWFALRPLRAELAVGRASRALAAGKPADAIADLEKATSLAGWVGRYWSFRTQAAESNQEVFAAIGFAEEAARRDPGSSQYALTAGKLNERYRDEVAARPWFEEALRRDPHNPIVILDVALFFDTVDPDRSIELARSVRGFAQTAAGSWVAEGNAAIADGRRDDGIDAYHRALELDPGQTEASQALMTLEPPVAAP